MKRKTWTDEEVHFLEDKWGTVSVKGIAKTLGRSFGSVKLKAYRLGLLDPRFCYEGITLNQLAQAINADYRMVKGWVQFYGFPAKKKIFVKESRIYVVRYEDFWEWAEANKQMIDFSRIEKNILGPEPDWAEAKRNADIIKGRKIKRSHNDAWSVEEDNILKGMLNAYCYTYPEIANRVKRSEGAVKRRIRDLGLKARPIRRNNHIKYTTEEVLLIESLLAKGHCLEDIASRINKSALGVRGKLERMGYKFKNGVPYKIAQ